MDYQLISADDHIDLRYLPRDLWQTRVPAAARDRVPRVEDTDQGPMWLCGDSVWGAWGRGGHSALKWALDRTGESEAEAARPTTPHLRLADLDRDGVDATVMYGPVAPLLVPDPAIRQLCYAAYNDWGGRNSYGNVSGSQFAGAFPSTSALRIPFGFELSFDRPFHGGFGNSPQAWEIPFLQWLARMDIAVDVCTSRDLHFDAPGLDEHRLLIFVGHHEYWTAQMRTHVEEGCQLLADIDFGGPVADIIYQSHERHDGSGYPRGLRGEEILLEARILAIADTVEAMCSPRSYRPAAGMDAAIEEINRAAGRLYDPALVTACARTFTLTNVRALRKPLGHRLGI